MLFQCYVQRLFSAHEHIVLFEENKARYPDFDYDPFEMADIENSECKSKLHFKKLICQSQLKLRIFLKDSATLRHKKKKIIYMGRADHKQKRN